MHPCTFFAAPSKEKQGNATNHQTLSSSAFSPFFCVLSSWPMKVHALKVQRNLNCVLKQQTNSRWGTSNKPKPRFVVSYAHNCTKSWIQHCGSSWFQKKYKISSQDAIFRQLPPLHRLPPLHHKWAHGWAAKRNIVARLFASAGRFTFQQSIGCLHRKTPNVLYLAFALFVVKCAGNNHMMRFGGHPICRTQFDESNSSHPLLLLHFRQLWRISRRVSLHGVRSPGSTPLVLQCSPRKNSTAPCPTTCFANAEQVFANAEQVS